MEINDMLQKNTLGPKDVVDKVCFELKQGEGIELKFADAKHLDTFRTRMFARKKELESTAMRVQPEISLLVIARDLKDLTIKAFKMLQPEALQFDIRTDKKELLAKGYSQKYISKLSEFIKVEPE